MKLINHIEKIVKVVCIVLMFLIVATCFMQVVYRYVFSKSFPWVEEMAVWAMIYMTFLGSVLGIIDGSHARIEFFLTLIPPKARRFVEAFNNVVCAILSIVLVYFTFPLISRNINNLSPGMRIPIAVMYISLVMGGILFAIFFSINAHKIGKTNITEFEKGVN